MRALSAANVTTKSSPEASHPAARRVSRARRVLRAVAIVTAVMASIGLTGTVDPSALPRATADAVGLVPGIAVTPAPAWVIENQGPGWVVLHNPLATAEFEIKVKPAVGADAVGLLQRDIGQLNGISTTGLTNVQTAGAPNAIALQGPTFTNQASVSFNADGSSRSGALPVTGWFTELLNPTTHQSAFVVFAQNGDAPIRADADAQAMLDSLQQ